jgi:hypothetical protein
MHLVLGPAVIYGGTLEHWNRTDIRFELREALRSSVARWLATFNKWFFDMTLVRLIIR